jgi:hypothetical protein
MLQITHGQIMLQTVATALGRRHQSGVAALLSIPRPICMCGNGHRLAGQPVRRWNPPCPRCHPGGPVRDAWCPSAVYPANTSEILVVMQGLGYSERDLSLEA